MQKKGFGGTRLELVAKMKSRTAAFNLDLAHQINDKSVKYSNRAMDGLSMGTDVVSF